MSMRLRWKLKLSELWALLNGMMEVTQSSDEGDGLNQKRALDCRVPPKSSFTLRCVPWSLTKIRVSGLAVPAGNVWYSRHIPAAGELMMPCWLNPEAVKVRFVAGDVQPLEPRLPPVSISGRNCAQAGDDRASEATTAQKPR